MLEAVSGINHVYDYHEETPDGYPVASFEISRISNVELDSCNNEVTYEFEVLVQIKIDTTTPRGTARTELDTIIDEIVEETNQNNDLNGTCLRSLISSVDTWQVSIQDKWEVAYAYLRYLCVTADFTH